MQIPWSSPHNTPLPSVTPNGYLGQAAEVILHVLQNSKNKIPTLTFSNPATNNFVHLAQIIKRASRKSLITSDLDSTPLLVVPRNSPVSYARVARNIAPLETAQHNNLVPLEVPKNNHVFSMKVTLNVAPLEMAQHNNVIPPRGGGVSKTELPKLPPKTIDPYTQIISHIPHPLRSRHTHFTRSRLNGFLDQSVQSTGTQYAKHIFNQDTCNTLNIENLIKEPDSTIRKRSLSNELGRLAQGVVCSRQPHEWIKGTDTIFFIPHAKVPKTQKSNICKFYM